MTEEQKPTQSETKKSPPNGSGLALGIALGIALGVALNNIGVGVALGIVFGLGFDEMQKRKNQNNQS